MDLLNEDSVLEWGKRHIVHPSSHWWPGQLSLLLYAQYPLSHIAITEIVTSEQDTSGFQLPLGRMWKSLPTTSPCQITETPSDRTSLYLNRNWEKQWERMTTVHVSKSLSPTDSNWRPRDKKVDRHQTTLTIWPQRCIIGLYACMDAYLRISGNEVIRSHKRPIWRTTSKPHFVTPIMPVCLNLSS